MKKTYIVSLLAFLTSVLSHAYDFEFNGAYYNVVDPTMRTVELTYYSAPLENPLHYVGDITIPATVAWTNGNVAVTYQVVAVGDAAFFGCVALTSVTLPSGVTRIGDNAFSGCSALTSVNIPESVTRIGANAFQNCSSLTSVTIPYYLSSIGANAFSGCGNLALVQAETRNPMPTFSSVFSGISSSCRLVIPFGSSASYAATGWNASAFPGGVSHPGHGDVNSDTKVDVDDVISLINIILAH